MYWRCRLNQAANSSWLRSRQLISRTVASQLPAGSFTHYSRPLSRVLENSSAILPSWIYLAMILIATAAICLTVNLRGHAQLSTAKGQFQQMQSEIDALRRSNMLLQQEVLRITTEPTTIESAARERLGMVRPTDVVVPLQSRSATNLASLSVVR